MEKEKQIKNFYEIIPKQKKVRNPGYELHGLDIPHYLICIGPSGSGKTNILLDFLNKATDTFSKICICLKTSDEPLYNFVQNKAPEVEFFENGEIPNIKEFDGQPCSLIVFDDLVLEKDQSKISEFYIRGRKKNITCWYLSQSYYKIPKNIRINARYIILKKLSSNKDLKLLLSEYNLGFELNEILDLYEQATKDFTGFLLIDTRNNTFKKNFLGV